MRIEKQKTSEKKDETKREEKTSLEEQRPVDHVAAEGEGAGARRLVPLEGVDQLTRPVDVLAARRERRLDRRDLRRMDHLRNRPEVGTINEDKVLIEATLHKCETTREIGERCCRHRTCLPVKPMRLPSADWRCRPAASPMSVCTKSTACSRHALATATSRWRAYNNSVASAVRVAPLTAKKNGNNNSKKVKKSPLWTKNRLEGRLWRNLKNGALVLTNVGAKVVRAEDDGVESEGGALVAEQRRVPADVVHVEQRPRRLDERHQPHSRPCKRKTKKTQQIDGFGDQFSMVKMGLSITNSWPYVC